MRKILFIASILLLAGCASTKDKFSPDACSFDIKITEVKGTRVKFTITPQDEYACYAFGILNSYDPSFNEPAKTLAENQIGWMNERYDMMSSDGEYSGSFMDMFCYRGPRSLSKDNLSSDTEHKLIIMQVNPETHSIIGEPVVVQFRTKQVLKNTSLTFDIRFEDDKVIIVPSDLNVTYCWDYENKELIENRYITPNQYFRRLIYMYEDYEFMDNILSKGRDEWEFSAEDPDMVEGETCTLVVAGYENGEINTDLTILDFIYHKGNITPLY